MDPNSTHQLWSQWTFLVHECGRHVPKKDVKYNAARWIAAGFGRTGKVRVTPTRTGWAIEAIVESRPAHDPAFVNHVALQFQQNFVAKGWGPLAFGEVSARVLAGDEQRGEPRKQWIEMPSIIEAVKA